MNIKNEDIGDAMGIIERNIERVMSDVEMDALIRIFEDMSTDVYSRGRNYYIRYCVNRYLGGPMDDVLFRATNEYAPMFDINPSGELFSPKDMVYEFKMSKARDVTESEYTDYDYNKKQPPPNDISGIIKSLSDIYTTLQPKNTADTSRTVLNDWLSYDSVNIKRRKIVCDSRFRQFDSVNINTPILTWVINTTDQVGWDGTIRVLDLDRVKKVIGESVWLPVIDIGQLNMRVIRVSITNLDPRSPSWDLINGNRNIKRNFQITYNLDQMSGNRAHFVPDDGYVFDVPLTSITEINLQILAPSGIYILPHDHLMVTIMTFANPTIFEFLINGVPADTGLDTGDIISFINFQSDNRPLDESVNRFIGWPVTVITPSSFSVGINTLAPLDVININPTIYIEKYRFSFEFTFHCLL
jgi:hypothetical protein